ncbi:hypothetical protein [uncultured phage MedDCM-OCT-S08-C1615]|nr:hypothetical protein [uncultured phage MedDCM-OCT-S08-C1615]
MQDLADTPDEHFVLDPVDYAAVEDKGEIVAVIHSHPTTNHNPHQLIVLLASKAVALAYRQSEHRELGLLQA